MKSRKPLDGGKVIKQNSAACCHLVAFWSFPEEENENENKNENQRIRPGLVTDLVRFVLFNRYSDVN